MPDWLIVVILGLLFISFEIEISGIRRRMDEILNELRKR